MKEIDWDKIMSGLVLWQQIVAVMSGVMVAGVILVLGNRLPVQIPLYYSRPWGEEQLVHPTMLVWPIAAVWIITLIGLLVSRTKIEKILAAFTAGAGLAAEIIIVLGIIRVFLIIT